MCQRGRQGHEPAEDWLCRLLLSTSRHFLLILKSTNYHLISINLNIPSCLQGAVGVHSEHGQSSHFKPGPQPDRPHSRRSLWGVVQTCKAWHDLQQITDPASRPSIRKVTVKHLSFMFLWEIVTMTMFSAACGTGTGLTMWHLTGGAWAQQQRRTILNWYRLKLLVTPFPFYSAI